MYMLPQAGTPHRRTSSTRVAPPVPIGRYAVADCGCVAVDSVDCVCTPVAQEEEKDASSPTVAMIKSYKAKVRPTPEQSPQPSASSARRCCCSLPQPLVPPPWPPPRARLAPSKCCSHQITRARATHTTTCRDPPYAAPPPRPRADRGGARERLRRHSRAAV